MENGMTGRAKGAIIALFLGVLSVVGWERYLKEYDPLYDEIEEDPCYQDGVFLIYEAGDYARFVGYVNRAYKEEGDDLEATALDAVLMADIDLTEAKYGTVKELPFLTYKIVKYRNFGGHPYIRQAMLSYAGTFEGNGHTITWFEDGGNGMFISLEREAVVRNLTLDAKQLTWGIEDYGVGMFCAVNYGTIVHCQTKGNLTGTKGYTGGLVGLNRGMIQGCVNDANVCVDGIGDYGAGGIAGLSKCKVLEGESEENPIVPVIEDCVNYGTITAPWKAGGICARNDCANIYHCGNEGNVTVQNQRGYIYPEEPEWYECAMAAGICGDMGWNTIEGCYNTGKISILEEGEEATYAIAGNSLFWINTVQDCVTLPDTATGHMRHESVMELDKEELMFWKDHREEVPYIANNWRFDLEEAKQKLPIRPLSLTQSPLTKDQDNQWLCDDFYLKVPDDYTIEEVSPYAICIEQKSPHPEESSYQIWLMRLEDHLVNLPASPDKDATHDAWLNIPGAHWLHPSHSYADDCHLEYSMPAIERLDPQLSILHYRDDILAPAAIQEKGGMIDNIVALPLTYTPAEGYTANYLLLFTAQETNYRPSLSFAKEILQNFIPLPAHLTVAPGDTLSSLSKTYTGTSSRYPELATQNHLQDPNTLSIDQPLTLPPEWLLY